MLDVDVMVRWGGATGIHFFPDSGKHAAMAIVNRRARHEYHILETFEAGIMLCGPEVKSLRKGQANLAEAHCLVRNDRVWLINCHISPYKPAAMNNPKEPA
ncbi:MAG: SsrA-binding protein, partial [Mariprofundus sp.]